MENRLSQYDNFIAELGIDVNDPSVAFRRAKDAAARLCVLAEMGKLTPQATSVAGLFFAAASQELLQRAETLAYK